MQKNGIQPINDKTDIFITPGFNFQLVDAMITNFHLPESSLIMLVSAFAGRETILKSYRHAVDNGYRFYSYGDSMFIDKVEFVKFKLIKSDKSARLGELQFRKGLIQTPVFMPVGTYGSVKTMTPHELIEIGAEIILANTYHLMIRPGKDILSSHGGLHQMMAWSKPILTDSGGYQIWSLSKRERSMMSMSSLIHQSMVT